MQERKINYINPEKVLKSTLDSTLKEWFTQKYNSLQEILKNACIEHHNCLVSEDKAGMEKFGKLKTDIKERILAIEITCENENIKIH